MDRPSTQPAVRSQFQGSADGWDSGDNCVLQERSRWAQPKRAFLRPTPKHLRDSGWQTRAVRNSIQPAGLGRAIPPEEPDQTKRHTHRKARRSAQFPHPRRPLHEQRLQGLRGSDVQRCRRPQRPCCSICRPNPLHLVLRTLSRDWVPSISGMPRSRKYPVGNAFDESAHLTAAELGSSVVDRRCISQPEGWRHKPPTRTCPVSVKKVQGRLPDFC